MVYSNIQAMETVRIKPENQRRLTVETCNDGQGVRASTGFTVKTERYGICELSF